MNHDELDRLFNREQKIIPSSGFTASVMNAVRRQTQVPPPIPFPWTRALPGMAAAVFSLAWTVFACVAVFSSKDSGAAFTVNLPPALLPLWHAALWLLAALITTMVALAISSRFVSRIA